MNKKPDEIIKILLDFKNKAGKKTRIKEMILFGSRARKNAKENSDIDIILVSEDFKGQKSFKRPAQFYADWDYDYDTDIICLTPKEFEIKKKQVGIIRNAIKEGILIK